MKPEDLTFDYAQHHQPWALEYAARHQRDVAAYRSPFMVSHCVMHITKALGKIARVLEELDHSNDGPVPLDKDIETIVLASADIVASCLKLCTVYGHNMAELVMRRAKEKDGVGY